MWQKREGEWEKERQARERLMKEVGKLIFICAIFKSNNYTMYTGTGITTCMDVDLPTLLNQKYGIILSQFSRFFDDMHAKCV